MGDYKRGESQFSPFIASANLVRAQHKNQEGISANLLANL